MKMGRRLRCSSVVAFIYRSAELRSKPSVKIFFTSFVIFCVSSRSG
jgi:hypothetical protein